MKWQCKTRTYDTPDELVGDAHLVAALRPPLLPLPLSAPSSSSLMMYLTVSQTGHSCQGPRSAPSQSQETS